MTTPPDQAQPREQLHQYRATLLRSGCSLPLIVQGGSQFVERYFSRLELCRSFGGYILSRTPESGEEFLGVWGVRNASRFRRLLRERGACFDIESHDVPPFEPKIITQHWDESKTGHVT